MKVLVIDIGGTRVKLLLSGESEPRKFDSGPTLTPDEMITQIKNLTQDWSYDVVSIGYPAPVIRSKIITEPHNLGKGWVGYDFNQAVGKPVKILNDAAMQALGSYTDGKMLFLGLGTGLGSAMVIEGIVEPMELAHMRFRKRTFEDYVGLRGLERYGKKKWRKLVIEAIETLSKSLEPDYVVLGGGNVTKLKEIPANCRLGSNAHAFEGGFRMWKQA